MEIVEFFNSLVRVIFQIVLGIVGLIIAMSPILFIIYLWYVTVMKDSDRY